MKRKFLTGLLLLLLLSSCTTRLMKEPEENVKGHLIDFGIFRLTNQQQQYPYQQLSTEQYNLTQFSYPKTQYNTLFYRAYQLLSKQKTKS